MPQLKTSVFRSSFLLFVKTVVFEKQDSQSEKCKQRKTFSSIVWAVAMPFLTPFLHGEHCFPAARHSVHTANAQEITSEEPAEMGTLPTGHFVQFKEVIRKQQILHLWMQCIPLS